jgi:hypothetical protein
MSSDAVRDEIVSGHMSLCGKCSGYTKRSRRQGLFDFVCFLFGLYPYRCLRCGRRAHLRQRN